MEKRVDIFILVVRRHGIASRTLVHPFLGFGTICAATGEINTFYLLICSGSSFLVTRTVISLVSALFCSNAHLSVCQNALPGNFGT